MKISDIKPEIYTLAEQVEAELQPVYAEMDRTAALCTAKVMAAFQDNRVAEACFAGTTGYGYDDLGRDTLDKIYAQIFGTEAALVRVQFVNGTHALTCALFALCRPGETLLAATGAPYDTLRGAIGTEGDHFGSLKFYGIGYKQVDLTKDAQPDIPGIVEAIRNDPSIRAVHLQRSGGYEHRRAFTVQKLQEVIEAIKAVDPTVNVMVDNCYGEFTDVIEPTNVGADLIAGSLIKNPGGGLAPTGGYIAGRAELVERAAFHLTVPGIGGECGSTFGTNRSLYQGLFFAPHVTAQALKTAAFCAGIMKKLGMEVLPEPEEKRSDIIQVVMLGSEDGMRRFCRGIQAGAPVDSFVTPEPWAMPGYNDPVIMAAGAFIQGASIELSADGPVREPYAVYMQGGLTYESGKLGIMMAASALLSENG